MKNKLGLSLLTGLTTLSVATPLATSCAKTNKYISHVHESEEDKLYGINASTYENLKKDYINQYQDQMLEHGFIEGSDEWKQEMNNLNYSLNAFDEKSKTMEMSYGQLTTGLMNYAKTNNHLALRRTTAAKPSDIDDMYQGARNSFDLYMDQLGFSSSLKAIVLTSADNKFSNLKTKLQEKGTMENDPYGALQEAKLSLLDCFETINAEISRYSSMLTMSNFKKLYTLVYVDDTYLDDLLTNPGFQKGKPISADLMNLIFNCIDVETGSKVNFRKDIMTGYVLTPTLKDIKIDNKTNKHEIDIEWSCISNTYINSNDAETIKTATAYEYENIDNKTIEKILNLKSPSSNDIFDLLTTKTDVTMTNFKLETEKAKLKTTYFDDTKLERILFKFPDASDKHAKLDPFYLGANGIKTVDGVTKEGWLSTDALSQTGMMISSDGGETYEYLSDVIASTTADDFDKSQATLSQQLVLNCNVNAVVREVNKSNHEIQIKFYVRYKNSSYDQGIIDNWLLLSNDTSCSNYPISMETFLQFSKDYSQAADYVNMYRDNKLQEAIDSFIPLTVVASIEAAISIGLITYFSYVIYRMTALPSVATRRKYFPHTIVGLIYSILCLGTFAYSLTIYGIYINNAREFQKEIKQFNKTDEAKEVYSKLDEGSKIFVKMTAPTYEKCAEPETTVQTKYDAFKFGEIEEFERLDLFYKTVPDKDSPFNKRAGCMQFDISKDAYTNLLNKMIHDPKILVADILSSIGILLLAVPTMLVVLIESDKGQHKWAKIGKFSIQRKKQTDLQFMVITAAQFVLLKHICILRNNLSTRIMFMSILEDDAEWMAETRGVAAELKAKQDAFLVPEGMTLDRCIEYAQKDAYDILVI